MEQVRKSSPKLLLETGEFQVIFRPHPQSFISFPAVIKEMEDLFSDNETFEIDKKASGAKSLQKANIMITDVSGVAFDFAFLQNKPIVFFDVPFTGKGLEAFNLKNQSWDLSIRDQLGALLQEDELEKFRGKSSRTNTGNCGAGQVIFGMILKPLVLFLGVIFDFLVNISGNYGLSLILLSIVVNIILIPVYYPIEKIKDKNKSKQKEMDKEIAVIKECYRGQERFYYIMIMNTILSINRHN
jgi:uncharacterized membrane protein